MKYQVIYQGRAGSAVKIANIIARLLPELEYELVDLDMHSPHADAEVIFFCFETSGGMCPISMLEFMEGLDKETILLLGTSCVENDPQELAKLECQIAAFLPYGCNYLGFYLCKGRMRQADLPYVKAQAKKHGKDYDDHQLQELYDESQSHPDLEDLGGILQFVKSKLQI